MKYKFHDGLPESCPPADAKAVNRVIYRGIKKLPIGAKDFLSAAETESRHSDPSKCQHWGLSVWLTEEAAEHGRRLMDHMRKWHVAKGPVREADGLLLDTSTNEHPGHFTFWKATDELNIDDFEIALYPIPPGED